MASRKILCAIPNEDLPSVLPSSAENTGPVMSPAFPLAGARIKGAPLRICGLCTLEVCFSAAPIHASRLYTVRGARAHAQIKKLLLRRGSVRLHYFRSLNQTKREVRGRGSYSLQQNWSRWRFMFVVSPHIYW